MKIRSIRTAGYAHAPSYGASARHDQADSESRRKSWIEAGAPVASPMSKYPRYAGPRTEWLPTWRHFCCAIEAEDGTVGVSVGVHGRPVAAVIDDYLGPRLVGEDALNIAGIYDMAVDLCAPFGASGLASFAISAIDLALWDLNGKLLGRPVYDLLGGRVQDDLVCYATGADTQWYR
jgi:L-rhamnonate dehydratase